MIRPRRSSFGSVIALMIVASTFVSGTHAAAAASAALFTGLGGHSRAYGVSADGSFAVGFVGAQSDSFRWSPPAAATLLPRVSGATGGQASAASSNGSVVVGVSYHAANAHPWRWTPTSGTVDLGFLPGTNNGGSNAVSSDGGVVVGTVSADPSGTGQQAFRWTAPTGMVSLGAIGGTGNSDARGVSADGNIVVGISNNTGFRWTTETGMQPVGTFRFCSAISGDGSVIVGIVGEQAYKWSQTTGMVPLGNFGANYDSFPMGVSADGTTIVGYGLRNSPSFDWSASIWTPASGMQRVQDVLTAAGVDLSGWKLNVASAVSADGQVLAGWGVHNGTEEAWMATLPEPASSTLLLFTACAVCLRSRFNRPA
jgi:uncharacterized membrane protein